jgi:hypothetical protein
MGVARVGGKDKTTYEIKAMTKISRNALDI